MVDTCDQVLESLRDLDPITVNALAKKSCGTERGRRERRL